MTNRFGKRQAHMVQGKNWYKSGQNGHPYEIKILSMDGSTLTETLVALVLLLTILVPLTSSWVYFLRTQGNRTYSMAIDYAVTEMEDVLATKRYLDKPDKIDQMQDGVRVITNVEHDETLARIQVMVLTETYLDTLYSLTTVRSLP